MSIWMNMKKKNKLFKNLLIIAFVIYMGLFIASESGFYEAKLSNKVALTDEAIKRFEQDVSDGKMVDVASYVVDDYKDYSNKFTDVGEKMSDAITKLLSEGINGAWDAIKVLFF